MEWVTWYATHAPERITSEVRNSYENNVHLASPALLGALAAVSSLDGSIYDDLRPVLKDVYRLEEEIAVALMRLDSPEHHKQAVQDLTSSYAIATDWANTFPERLAEMMNIARTPVHHRRVHAEALTLVKPEDSSGDTPESSDPS